MRPEAQEGLGPAQDLSLRLAERPTALACGPEGCTSALVVPAAWDGVALHGAAGEWQGVECPFTVVVRLPPGNSPQTPS